MCVCVCSVSVCGSGILFARKKMLRWYRLRTTGMCACVFVCVFVCACVAACEFLLAVCVILLYGVR